MNKTYIIDCTVYDSSGKIIGKGKVKVKNQPDQYSAQIQLHKYMAKRFPEFRKLVVNSCTDEFDGIMDVFGQIFGNKFR